MVEHLAQDHRAGDDHRSPVGIERRELASLRERERCEALELPQHAFAREAVTVHPVGVVLRQPEVERGERGDRPGDADRGPWADFAWDALREQGAHGCSARLELLLRWRIRMEEPLGEADAAEIEAVVEAKPVRPSDDELGRAAADVDHQRVLGDLPARRGAAKRQLRLLMPGE